MPETKTGTCEKCGAENRLLYGVNKEDFIPENYPQGGTTIVRYVCKHYCLRG